MKKLSLHILKWLLPINLVLVGIFCYLAIHGHQFLGLICFGIAGVLICYFLIALLKSKHYMVAKALRTILTSLLCLGILLFAIAEVLVLKASLGDPEEECQYILVLGAKVNGTVPSLSLSERIDTAYAYLTEHPNVIAILTGGQGPDEGISEAQCMFNLLTAQGIDPQRLWLEDKATSTWENLVFSANLIESKTGIRPEKLGIVSSEYHLYRAGLFAGDCGIDAVGIPAKTSWFTIRLNYFLREAAGVWHYLILGGQYHD